MYCNSDKYTLQPHYLSSMCYCYTVVVLLPHWNVYFILIIPKASKFVSDMPKFMFWRLFNLAIFAFRPYWLLFKLAEFGGILYEPYKTICIGGYLIWRFLGPSQIHQLKSPPNINRFTVATNTYCLNNAHLLRTSPNSTNLNSMLCRYKFAKLHSPQY